MGIMNNVGRQSGGRCMKSIQGMQSGMAEAVSVGSPSGNITDVDTNDLLHYLRSCSQEQLQL
jgi:hypothetical protein